MMAKKCTKKKDVCAKLLFCQSKAIAFLLFLLPLLSWLLKLPIYYWQQLVKLMKYNVK